MKTFVLPTVPQNQVYLPTTHSHHPPPWSAVQYCVTSGDWSNIALHSQVVMYFVIRFPSDNVAKGI